MISSISVLIADDHPVVTAGLRGLLEIEPDIKVIGQASNVADVVHRVLELNPDILLLDLRMPPRPSAEVSPRGGLDAWKDVQDLGSMTRTILFAAELETREIIEAIELGVCGFLLKDAATEFLVESIRTVMSGACWDGTKTVPTFHALMTTMGGELTKRKFGLTPRELQVVSAIVRHGMANKDIAHFFKIAEDTVKKHISSSFDKLGVSNRLELDREFSASVRDDR